MLFGWVTARSSEEQTHEVLASMSGALHVSTSEREAIWVTANFGIGILALEDAAAPRTTHEPARDSDGTALWMSGEAFDWPSHGGLRTVAESRCLSFRMRLLTALRAEGAGAIRDLDGEYQLALWNPAAKTLQLFNDRFGALPLYVGESSQGLAFAGGVRGVLMAPGIDNRPDVEAIKEAVTFGGYRLGARTNVRGVRMVPPATVVSLSNGAMSMRRYWTWSELRDGDVANRDVLLNEVREAWSAAISRRLEGARTPGLMLSGGLDSRAILAEAARQECAMTAITYGTPHSDDATIAARAARMAGAQWALYPLYADGWLERRTRRIVETDGLMDLVDLMHTEVFDTMPSRFDVYLSGYIGDAVAGSSLYAVNSAEDLVRAMPYYGGDLGLSYADALATAETMIAATPGPARYALYEQKFPQSTSRVTAAARPYVTVRRPFVDYRFFDAVQRVPAQWRADHAFREQWLVSTYPEFFARIPNQRTGVPAGSSRVRWHVTRAVRFGWRRALAAAARAGAPVTVADRSYHPDERFWSQPADRAAIESTILRRDSISGELFGRDRLRAVLARFFDAGDAPVQVVGALYVFEHYHQTLGAFLAGARRDRRLHAC